MKFEQFIKMTNTRRKLAQLLEIEENSEEEMELSSPIFALFEVPDSVLNQEEKREKLRKILFIEDGVEHPILDKIENLFA